MFEKRKGEDLTQLIYICTYLQQSYPEEEKSARIRKLERESKLHILFIPAMALIF